MSGFRGLFEGAEIVVYAPSIESPAGAGPMISVEICLAPAKPLPSNDKVRKMLKRC